MYTVNVSLCGIHITEFIIQALDALAACNRAEQQMKTFKSNKVDQLVKSYKLADLFFDYEARYEIL